MPHYPLLLIITLLPLISPWCLRSTINVTQTVDTIDYSPDGTLIAITMSGINTVTIYDTNNFAVQFTYIPPTGTPTTARFTRNGNYLVVGLSNGNVNIINGKTPFSSTVNFTYTVNSGSYIVDLALNSLGNKMLVCTSSGNNFYVNFNFLSNTTTLYNKGLGSTAKGCKWSLNDDAVLIDSSGNAYTYSVPANGNMGSVNYKSKADSTSFFNDLAVRPTATAPIKVVLAGGGGGSANNAFQFSNTGSNSMVTNNAITFTNNPTNNITSACYSSDGSTYAFASADFKMWAFNDSNVETAYFTDSTYAYSCCAVNNDGSAIIGGTTKSGTSSYLYIYTKTCLYCDTGSYFNSTTGICTSCITPLPACAMCVSSSVCSSCFQGFYVLVNRTCGSCSASIDGCSTCISGSHCVECNNGYYLLSNSCTACAITYTGCLSCTSSACLLCDMDYQLSTGACVKCTVTGCLRCDTASKCIECQSGMYVSGSGTACSNCGAGCLSCFNASSNCTNCLRGYVLSGTSCNICSSNCLECSATSCLDCSLGYFSSGTGCSLCTTPCFTCSLATNNCTSCAIGYFLTGNTCNQCTNNCTICNSSSYCYACSVGYYLTGSNACLSCASQYTGCTQCTLGSCTACDQTRYLASATSCTVCHSAMPGCQVCSNGTTCTLCAVGYYYTAASGATACSICPAQCEICYSGTNCTACTLGYWLNTNTCSACTAPCATCTTASACLSCTANYYISGTGCNPCTDLSGCLSCLSSTYCIMCMVGFYPNGGACSACPSNCLQCNSTNCFSCNLGHYVSAALVCSACSANCSICSTWSVCQSCDVGYYLNTNTCATCATINTACLTCNASNTCLACAKGYYLSGGNCSSCQNGVTYCTICASSAVCTLCFDGYYLAAANSCLACSALTGCLSCADATTCTLCANGYYLNTGLCYLCPANCTTCSSSSNCSTCNPQFYLSSTSCVPCSAALSGCQSCSSNSACLSCGGGYLLATNVCQPCSATLPACSLCNTTGVCQSCQQGYFLNGTNNCQLCSTSATLANCLLCNSSSVCQYCQTGYYLASNVCNLCSAVLTNCQQCLNGSVCLDCASGYYLVSNACTVCQSALPGCIFCASSTNCTQCQSGYYVNGLTCSPCSQAGCNICDPTVPTNCITCTNGYYKSGSTCLACAQLGCLNCDSSACTLCQSGYYLSSGSCTLCTSSSTGCSKCSAAAVCSECQSLFYLSGTSCLSCSSAMVGCTFCSGSSSCHACDGGYYLSGGICSPCSNIAGCLICNTSSSCLTCTAGYYLSSNSCLSCSIALTNCYQCYTSTTCASCANGYELSTSGGCQAMKVSSGSAAPSLAPPELKFKSYYFNDTMLRHTLSVSDGSKFQKYQSINWTSVTKIYLENVSNSTLLTVLATELSLDNTTLIFFTNNPIKVNKISIPMTSAGRKLVGQSMQSLQLASSFALPQSVINTVLPSLLITNDLEMTYHLDASQFYTSFVLSNFQFNLYIFGLLIVGLLFVYGLVRSACYPLIGRNIEIAGHLIALKTMPLVVYPTFAEYVNFSLGFFAADLPWLSKMLPDSFFNTLDSMPMGYLFYYKNMNFAAMQLLSFTVFLVILILAYYLLSQDKQQQISLQKEQIIPNFKFKSFKDFLCNFFCFGLTFAGFSSVIGAFLNKQQILSLNGIFYILGVVVFGVAMSEAFSKLIMQKNMGRVRVALKGTLLAAAGLNPLYLAATAILVDTILMIVEYCMRKNNLRCPKAWLLSNIFAVTSLAAFYFVPDSLLTLYIVMGLASAAVLFEFYQFCHEKGLNPQQQHKFYEAYSIRMEGSFWDLAHENISEKDELEKDPKKHQDEKEDKLIFNSFAQDQGENRDARTTSYSNKGFEPKRRARKFKKQNSVSDTRYLQANDTYTSSWTKNIPTKDLPDILEEEP